MPNSTNSSPPLTSTLSMKITLDSKNLEPSPIKDSNLIYKNHHLQHSTLSLSRSQGRRTKATLDEFDLMNVSSSVEKDEHEYDNKHQGSFSKTQAIIKDGRNPKGSGKGKYDKDGFKCMALCMYLPGFGHSGKKQVKARKGETKIMDHHVDPIMSSTFSFENFDHHSGIAANEKNEDESISSYFELPISQMVKYNGTIMHSERD
ncbi:hypothetical protein TanjilG_15043 [Lupinus angustifolius]|uniref:Uncharacterized protein n=1 Tax=Lupinus angustifolius TaxID=3871 RepID=A0A1J7GQZ9_LUPAN|nr:PREDICTED: uncharacterized protein LOC109333968 [Lupinus angustifolius]OIV92052.1 hypothetical protein TanjilG_15043 [Lupinus angustifolius]